MNFLPALATWQFAVAGAVCAAVPIVLHLLNRRRFRVVEWAAMQFLREALQRRRRIMEIRDLLLMFLRAAAILLFGLALARPFFAARQEQLDAGQPIHAVILIDNSLSMAYQALDGSLLDRAKQRAASFIDRLPVGSRISIVPLCGSEHGISPEPFDAKPFALEALQRVSVVDRSVNFRTVVNEARRAADSVKDLAQRFVLFTDQQRLIWSDLGGLSQQEDLPAVQLVDLSEADWGNSWVADVRVPDGVADAETPTTIQAILRHHGREVRRGVRVSLSVRDVEVDSQIVSFDSADATREVTFAYTFRDIQPEPSRPEFVPIKVVLTADRLTEDDERHALVPVVAALPVVFVDQYGSEEDPIRNQLGETRHLRHLLAPTTVGGEAARQLIRIRHLQISELDRDVLADARLVVIAGISDPSEKVSLLREYVQQGGQLVIAAGGSFDPVMWNQAAWLDGDGILPLPLLPELHGSLPEVAGRDLKPLFLSYESLGHHPYFQLAGNSDEDLRDLYSEPFFFQIVQVDSTPKAVSTAAQASLKLKEDESPEWLLWSPPESDEPNADNGSSDERSRDPARDASSKEITNSSSKRDTRPQVLARFTSESGPAYLVERSVGRGRVLFAASGILSSWSTLPKTNAIVIFDRILRSMIQTTLPMRNYGGVERIAVPLPNEAREDRITLTRPGRDAISESLDTGFLRTDQVGVVIERPLARGIYQLQALGPQVETKAEKEPVPRWQMQLSVNGDESESNLEPIDRTVFEKHDVAQHLRWVGAQEEISMAGARIRGQDLWWWLALIVFALLLLELAVIVWPVLTDRSRPNSDSVQQNAATGRHESNRASPGTASARGEHSSIQHQTSS
jgi:hypothetical protein